MPIDSASKNLERNIIGILDQCGENPPMFEDPDFAVSEESLYLNPADLPDYIDSFDGAKGVKEKCIEWLRPNQFAKNPDYFKSTSGCGAIHDNCSGSRKQCPFGGLNDEAVLGVFAAIAMHPDGLIDNLFVSEMEDFKKYGIYTCRFYKDGEWVEVATDTRVPCVTLKQDGEAVIEHDQDATSVLYGSLEDVNEVWIPLLQKAYAKLHGSYEVLHNFSIQEALIDCTGGSVKKFNLIDEATKLIYTKDDAMWDKFNQYQKHKAVVVCQLTQATISSREITNKGIIKNRLYIVLLFKQVKTLKFIKLKNPWTRGYWAGDWGNDDIKWRDNIHIEAALEDDEQCDFNRERKDGTFWMVFDDFIEIFNEIYVAKIFPDSTFQYVVRGEWCGHNAAGSYLPRRDRQTQDIKAGKTSKEKLEWIVKKDSEPNWHRNPQFRIKSSDERSSAKVTISLLQRDFRLYGGANFAINFVVVEEPLISGSLPRDKTPTIEPPSDPIASIIWELNIKKLIAECHSFSKTPTSPALPDREISKGNVIIEGGKSYVIIPYTDNPGVDMEFFLRIFTDKPVQFEALPHLHTSVLRGKWEIDEDNETTTAGGPLCVNFLPTGSENPMWCHNPQYWIQFKAKSGTPTSLKVILKQTLSKLKNLSTNSMATSSKFSMSSKTLNSSSMKIPKSKLESVSPGQLIGLTIVKPDRRNTLFDETHSRKRNKDDFKECVDESLSEEKKSDENLCNLPDKKLVVKEGEWCRISDYSDSDIACVYLPKISKEWVPDGLLVVPSLGEKGHDGNYELQIDSDQALSITEIPLTHTRILQGSWSEREGTAGGCHLHQDWKKNPKFFLHLNSARAISAKIKLSRSEKEWGKKCKQDVVGTMMGFYVLQGQKLSRDSSTLTVNGKRWSETDFVPEHQISSPDNLMLPPSFNECFIIMPTTWEPNKSGNFLLSVTAACDFRLSHSAA